MVSRSGVLYLCEVFSSSNNQILTRNQQDTANRILSDYRDNLCSFSTKTLCKSQAKKKQNRLNFADQSCDPQVEMQPFCFSVNFMDLSFFLQLFAQKYPTLKCVQSLKNVESVKTFKKLAFQHSNQYFSDYKSPWSMGRSSIKKCIIKKKNK